MLSHKLLCSGISWESKTCPDFCWASLRSGLGLQPGSLLSWGLFQFKSSKWTGALEPEARLWTLPSFGQGDLIQNHLKCPKIWNQSLQDCKGLKINEMTKPLLFWLGHQNPLHLPDQVFFPENYGKKIQLFFWSFGHQNIRKSPFSCMWTSPVNLSFSAQPQFFKCLLWYEAMVPLLKKIKFFIVLFLC